MSAIFREAAPAKINLYLHVLGVRPDGYHDLDSLVAFARVCDTVAVTVAEQPALTIDGPFGAPLAAEPPTGNLVWRALHALAEAVGRAPAVAIRLTKELPLASGIGGGSSDAAACLRALTRLWRLDPHDRRLRDVAAGLGADVPVCLAGVSAYFGGIGDQVEAAPALPSCPVVVVNPGVPLSTPAVFKARRGPFSAAARLIEIPYDVVALATLLEQRRNDLADAARGLDPAIDPVLDSLDAAPGCLLARLSGSGATCFGLFRDADDAGRAAARIHAEHPAWWVRATRLG
ncbi:MAG: 4-(cytidine 5'-diphospho)-2-C-methyl-D-erythritol kinase [Azospirillaceae bacterium]|nr:4-(cytidine 5'-diphospho)-2-C-methyl-D-erythritol kinase [Azospirillaceae bacterium]